MILPSFIRDTLDRLAELGPQVYVLVPVAFVTLLVLGIVLRRVLRATTAARAVSTLATVIGLGWTAQGMWDAAVHSYGVPVQIASVLFVLFEALWASQMLRAHEFRTDRPRRTRHVKAVWLIACVMGAVVALAEGWTQAPLRLSVPLLLTLAWYLDLTAEDDPADRPATSLRWTFRRAALAVGMLEPGERDAQTIDRDRLRRRMTRLAFNIHHGETWVTELLRRHNRLDRLKTVADDADLADVRARLKRSKLDLFAEPEPTPEVHPVMPPQPVKPEHVQPGHPATPPPPPPVPEPERLPQGVHRREGVRLRGTDLRTDALMLMWTSMAERPPRGMTSAELAALYTPPLGQRKAEEFAAEARRTQPARVNGHVPHLTTAS